MLQDEIEDGVIIQEWLTQRRGQRVYLRCTQKRDERETRGIGGRKCMDGFV